MLAHMNSRRQSQRRPARVLEHPSLRPQIMNKSSIITVIWLINFLATIEIETTSLLTLKHMLFNKLMFEDKEEWKVKAYFYSVPAILDTIKEMLTLWAFYISILNLKDKNEHNACYMVAVQQHYSHYQKLQILLFPVISSIVLEMLTSSNTKYIKKSNCNLTVTVTRVRLSSTLRPQ